GGSVQHGRRRVAEFGAEVTAFRANVLHDGGGGAQADVHFLQGVVVHQVELDVFVSTALTCRRIRFSDQVEFQAPRVRGRAGILCGRRFGWRWGRLLLRHYGPTSNAENDWQNSHEEIRLYLSGAVG